MKETALISACLIGVNCKYSGGNNALPVEKLKELDEYKHKLSLKVVKWIVVSQSVLIALSAALQLWLR